MKTQMLPNKYIKTRNGVDFSRNLFPYLKRHSTNLLSGFITPVWSQFLYPGTSPDFNFGATIESAPLISTVLDNVYVDIVCIWTPIRLVMPEWNEFLGESPTMAFTLNRNVTIPKIKYIYDTVGITSSGGQAPVTNYYTMSRAYLAEHCIGPHVGFRFHGYFDSTTVALPESMFYKGVSVLPSRVYELNWNVFFRNENVQDPILIDKSSTLGSHDTAVYQYGLGPLQLANKLKNFYTVATPAPSLLDVNLAMGSFAPVGILPSASGTSTGQVPIGWSSGSDFTKGVFKSAGLAASGGVVGISTSSIVTDLSTLTVNKMYYSLMLQRFANKMMKGRRAVEFYKNFFGVEDSDSGHDLPQLICHKRFPLNISAVIATANSTDIQSNDQPIGSRGAFSFTGLNGKLVKNFTATEHGYMQAYMIIRGQPSLATGIDKHLGYDNLFDTYLVNFDHIGPVGIERLELSDSYGNSPALNFGFTNAWYERRKQVSDVVGIMEPGEPLAYKTLALSYDIAGTNYTISDQFLRHDPRIIDRVFLFPVCGLGTEGSGTEQGWNYDRYGEPSNSNRYQFLVQFAVGGQYAAVLSRDSEPLQMRL